MIYDLIDINNKNFVSAHLAEGPGSFIQATMFYREKYSKYWKDDKYYAITIHPEDEGGRREDRSGRQKELPLSESRGAQRH